MGCDGTGQFGETQFQFERFSLLDCRTDASNVRFQSTLDGGVRTEGLEKVVGLVVLRVHAAFGLFVGQPVEQGGRDVVYVVRILPGWLLQWFGVRHLELGVGVSQKVFEKRIPIGGDGEEDLSSLELLW